MESEHIQRGEGFSCLPVRRLVIALALLVPLPLQAMPLEFRSDGFFASPDGRVKFFRESWCYAPHIDVDGKLAVSIVGPILDPGYVALAADQTKTDVDPVRRQLVESGSLGKLAAFSRRTVSEYQGGLLIRLEFGPTQPEFTEARCRLIFPIGVFQNRRARWDGGEILLPTEKPAPERFMFLNDPQSRTDHFRFDLGNGQELGVKILSPTKRCILADCRQWNDEMNYHLQVTFADRELLLFVCLLEPQDPFPKVTPPAAYAIPPAVQTLAQGAVFPTGDGQYAIQIAGSGEVQVRKQGVAFFSVASPFVREDQTINRLDQPVSLDVRGNQVTVISRSRDKPFRLRQSFTLEADGWLSVSSEFEGVEARTQQGRVELALPADEFRGKTIRAGERLIGLPATQAAKPTLFDDWDGRIRDYELPVDGAQRVRLVGDQKAASYLNDDRKWGSNYFKIGLTARDGAVKYRLRFWNEMAPPPRPAKGNLLRDGTSFETGSDGIRPFSCYSWNEKMVAPGIPPVFDTTTAVHGTTSLRLTAEDSVQKGNSRGFAFRGVIFNRVALQRDRKYTLSAYLKADRPGMDAVIYCGEKTWGGEDWGAFPVTTDWKRYHFSFYTDDFQKSGYYLTWIGMASRCKVGTLWIDAVQLEEGDLSEFQPPAATEYGVEVRAPGKLFETGAPCNATLHVCNNGPQPLTAAVAYVIRDYWDKEIRSGSLPVNVAAASTAVYPVDLGRLPGGYYRGYFTMPGGDIKEVIFGVYQPQPLTPLPEDWPLACHNDPQPLVRKLGFGSVRAFEIFEFASIAPEDGKFDFSRSDRMVQEAERSGLTIMPILGQFEWPSYRPEPPIPAYAQAKVTTSPQAYGQPVRTVWPKLDAWKAYVRALTSHYRGRISAWEVLNEPNLWTTPQDYLPYLRAAYEAAKEGNPDCQVVGVCATSDSNGKVGGFLENVLKLGGGKFFDILSVHLYNTQPPEQTFNVGSDRLLERWRRVLHEATGRDMPVWHTEESFIARHPAYSARKLNVPIEFCDEPQFLIDTFQHKAEYLIRETLLDAVAGHAGRFYWFGQFDEESSFITIRYFQPYGLEHTEYDQSPGPELIAANGLARSLTGMSHPYRQLELGGDRRGVVFTGDHGSVAALWNWKTTEPVTIHVAKTPCVLCNFFGEPIPVAPDRNDDLTVELESAPKYLSFPGQNGETCCRLLMAIRRP